MAKLKFEISMSLDGFVAGPSADLDNPLGLGGMQLHEWILGLEAWRKAHGLEGGETTPDSKLVEESNANVGAVLMGRRMFSGGEGPWDQDPNANGWWGEDPPFRVPVFVLTHYPREPLTLHDTTMTFVTEGFGPALEQAREAAGDADVKIAGGAEIAQQYLDAGLVDEMRIHLVPVLLGAGVRLFEEIDLAGFEITETSAISSPAVTHLEYQLKTRA